MWSGTKTKQEIDYFLAGPERKGDMVPSTKNNQNNCMKNIVIFLGIGFFKGTFSLRVKEGITRHLLRM